MEEQDAYQEHVWAITHEDHSPAYKFIRYEECMKCGAARVTELPSGDLIGIEPEGTGYYNCSGEKS